MRPKRPALMQPTSPELRDACLGILRSKFYGNSPEEVKAFNQDRSRLLAWVVLYPAAWLNKRGVTMPGDAYRETFVKVFIQAAAHIESKVKYRPAYLRQVVQSHWAIHGEDYYEAAKTVRNLADHALLVAGQMRQNAPDPVAELAKAAALIKPTVRKKKSVVKAPLNQQPSLL